MDSETLTTDSDTVRVTSDGRTVVDVDKLLAKAHVKDFLARFKPDIEGSGPLESEAEPAIAAHR